MSDTPNDQPYIWGGEHFCEPDLKLLYHYELHRIYDPAIGFPVKLDALPEPETFCAWCLKWFTDPVKLQGSDLQPPEESSE